VIALAGLAVLSALVTPGEDSDDGAESDDYGCCGFDSLGGVHGVIVAA
jgi:hypothetical protein